MTHQIYKVTSFEIAGSYRLKVFFDDGLSRIIDFLPILAGPLYGALLDRNLFAKVRIDPEIPTLVWPNGADFDPETLHDWPDYVKEFSAMTHLSERGNLRCAEDRSAYLFNNETGSR
jgi:hypothetical protein